MNIVEFALKFKDMASSPLRSFGEQSKNTFSQARSFADHLTGNNRVLGQSYNEIQKQIKQVENTIRTSTIPSQIRAAKKELEGLQKAGAKHPASMGGSKLESGGGGGVSALGMLGQFAAPAAIMAVGYKAGQWLGSAMKDGMERQKTTMSFEVMAGKDQGGKLLKDLIKYQNDTILGPEVVEYGQTMLQFGAKANEVVPDLKMLGDISMGNEEKLGSLTLAFSQVRAGGKLMGNDLLQFINAGFNPLQEMTKMSGKSMAVLRDEMSKGQISFNQVRDAIKHATSEGGTFNNMLGKIAETPAGKMEALSGQWAEFKTQAGSAFLPLIGMAADFGAKMMPLISDFVPVLASGVGGFVNMLKTAKPFFVEIIKPAVDLFKELTTNTAGWMDYVGIVKEYLVGHIFPVVKKIYATFADVGGQLIKFVQHSELLKDTFKFIAAIAGGIWDFIGGLIDAFKWIFDKIVMPILNAIESAHRWLKGSNGTDVTVTQVVKPALKLPEGEKKDTNSKLAEEIVKGNKENAQASATNKGEIVGGGQKILNVTVSKFFDNLNINSQTLPAALSDVEQKILEMLARVLSQGAASA